MPGSPSIPADAGNPSRPSRRQGRRKTIAVFAVFAVALAGLLAIHRDLSVTLGNSEWDYVGQVYNGGEGALDRAASLRSALQPDGFHGPGYALAAWATGAALRLAGISVEVFRAAQLVTALSALLLLLAGWRIGRAMGVPPELEWLPPALVACAWPFVSLAGQVTSQIPAAALVALAASLLLDGTRRRNTFGAGVVLGLALLLRAHVLLSFPAFLFATLVLAGRRTSPRHRILLAGSLSAGFILGAAPRLLLDFVQTGSPLFTIRPQILRAILLEGGLEAYRPDPASLLSIVLAQPGFFLSAFIRTYAFFLAAFLLPLAPALAILLRGRSDRRRAMASAALLCLIPLGVSLQPTPAIRFVIELFPIAAAIGASAVAAIAAGRGGRILTAALAATIAALFAIDLGLLADKYRLDLPEAGLRKALSRSGTTGPTVLVVPGIATDQGSYVNAIRYRLRRVDARFLPAPPALGPDDLRRLGAPPPVFLLLVPILDTGPSVLMDKLMGRDRLVFSPRPPEAAGLSSRSLFHDATSGVELFLVGGERSAAQPSFGDPDRR